MTLIQTSSNCNQQYFNYADATVDADRNCGCITDTSSTCTDETQTEGFADVSIYSITFQETVSVTPLPSWISPCKESLWREFWDPLHPQPTMIKMIVSLPYQVQDFTQGVQNKFKASVAGAVDVKSYRVTINQITDTQSNLPGDLLEVEFSVRVPAQSLGQSDVLRIHTHACTRMPCEHPQDFYRHSKEPSSRCIQKTHVLAQKGVQSRFVSEWRAAASDQSPPLPRARTSERARLVLSAK